MPADPEENKVCVICTLPGDYPDRFMLIEGDLTSETVEAFPAYPGLRPCWTCAGLICAEHRWKCLECGMVFCAEHAQQEDHHCDTLTWEQIWMLVSRRAGKFAGIVPPHPSHMNSDPQQSMGQEATPEGSDPPRNAWFGQGARMPPSATAMEGWLKRVPCRYCRVDLRDQEQYYDHIQGSRHLRKVRQYHEAQNRR